MGDVPLPGILGDHHAHEIDENVVVVGHRHPDTAHRAATRAFPRSGSFRRELCTWLAGRLGLGATDFEIEAYFGRSHQSASGARSTLKSDGWIEETRDEAGVVTRVNPYGNDATVWRLTPDGEREVADHG